MLEGAIVVFCQPWLAKTQIMLTSRCPQGLNL